MDTTLKTIYDALLYVELVLAVITGILYISAARFAPGPYRFLKLMLGFDLVYAAVILIQLSVEGVSEFENFQVRVGYTLLLLILFANALVGRRRYGSGSGE